MAGGMCSLLPYGTGICHYAILYSLKIFWGVSVHSLLYFSLIWYQWFRHNGQHVLALCALLTGVILKGLTFRKFVSDVCVCMFCVCVGIGFVDWLGKGWEEFWSVHLLMTQFDFPEVDRALKSNCKLTWCDFCFFFINGWFSQHSVSW